MFLNHLSKIYFLKVRNDQVHLISLCIITIMTTTTKDRCSKQLTELDYRTWSPFGPANLHVVYWTLLYFLESNTLPNWLIKFKNNVFELGSLSPYPIGWSLGLSIYTGQILLLVNRTIKMKKTKSREDEKRKKNTELVSQFLTLLR